MLTPPWTRRTGYLKTAAYRFAQLGYTTVVPNLYHMLGYPAETHIDKGTEIQGKTPDPDFIKVIDRGWRYVCGRGDAPQSTDENTQRPAASSVRRRAGDQMPLDDPLRRP